jgi:hypothetical protein
MWRSDWYRASSNESVVELFDGDIWIEGAGSTESQRKGKHRFEPTLVNSNSRKE